MPQRLKSPAASSSAVRRIDLLCAVQRLYTNGDQNFQSWPQEFQPVFLFVVIEITEEVSWIKAISVHQYKAFSMYVVAEREESLIIRMRPAKHGVDPHASQRGRNFVAISTVE